MNGIKPYSVSYDEQIEVARAMVLDGACPMPSVTPSINKGRLLVTFSVEIQVVSDDKVKESLK